MFSPTILVGQLALVVFFYISNFPGVLSAFSIDKTDNLAVYWGQDSAGHQQRLSFYCEDDTIDIIPMAFLYIFDGVDGLPVIDFSDTCGLGSVGTFEGSELIDCSFMESDIQTCQSKGKLVTLSLGGATSQVGFTSDAQAEEFGESIWNMFLGGESAIRPLGSVALDGIDLDIESGSSAHYAALVNKIRSLAQGADKRYYITAAPQCPFPDAYIGTALNEVNFDAVFVQFYNNYCEVSIPSEFNFATWDTWAKTQSPNSDIKVYLGAPGSPSAAGSGYVDIDTLSTIVQEAQSQYSSFGGVMLWDADSAYTNNRYDQAVKNALTQGVSVSPTSTNILSATSSPTSSKTSSKASSSSATSKASSKASSTSTKASTKASSATTSTTSSATTTPTSSASPLPQLAFPFRDPRKTARVKRPQGFTVVPREAAPTATLNKRLFNSRFFRQP